MSEKNEEMVRMLYNDRFNGMPGSTPRSEPYKEGFLFCLRSFYLEDKLETLPYQDGTPEMDAFYSGYDHAKQRLEYLDSVEILNIE